MKIGYMCSVEYDNHLENDWYSVPVFTSLRSIRHHKKCVMGKHHCGIYKVQIKCVKIMKKENL